MSDDAVLDDLARRYLWWQPPAQALSNRPRFLCQLMQLGTYDDVRNARRILGDDAFRDALTAVAPGVLDPRSWNFWHFVLFRRSPPTLPTRPLPP